MNDIRIENRGVAGTHRMIPIRDYRPADERITAKPLLWIHGGGFISGGLDQSESDQPARALASGRRVVTVDYRLAPKAGLWNRRTLGPHPNRFPAARDDVADVLSWLTGDTDAGIHLGGASAGANLAAAAAINVQGDSDVAIASTVLAYGLFHADLPIDPSVEESLDWLARPLFTAAMVRRMNLNYVGHEALQRPGPAFPGGADISGFPPTLMIDAEQDRLRASGAAFHRELQQADSNVEYEVMEGARHGFLSWSRGRAFRSSMSHVASWLRRHD